MERPHHGEDTRAKYIIYCNDYFMAERHAEKQKWHESQWRYYYDDIAPGKVVVFERQKREDHATI
jgi:hypothetical protein